MANYDLPAEVRVAIEALARHEFSNVELAEAVRVVRLWLLRGDAGIAPRTLRPDLDALPIEPVERW